MEWAGRRNTIPTTLDSGFNLCSLIFTSTPIVIQIGLKLAKLIQYSNSSPRNCRFRCAQKLCSEQVFLQPTDSSSGSDSEPEMMAASSSSNVSETNRVDAAVSNKQDDPTPSRNQPTKDQSDKPLFNFKQVNVHLLSSQPFIYLTGGIGSQKYCARRKSVISPKYLFFPKRLYTMYNDKNQSQTKTS